MSDQDQLDPVIKLEDYASDLKNHHGVSDQYVARYQAIDPEHDRSNGDVAGFFAIDRVDGTKPEEVIRFDFYPTKSENDWRVEVVGDFTFRNHSFPKSYDSWLRCEYAILNHLDNFQAYLVDQVERRSFGVMVR